MKKLIFAIILLALIMPVFAQNDSGENRNLYYVNVAIERIFTVSEGYLIVYRTQKGYATIGVPNEWFWDTENLRKGDMVRLPRGVNWPTMSVFYADGEFSHVRLYVHPSRSHSSWGTVSQGTDVSGYFPGDGSFNLQF